MHQTCTRGGNEGLVSATRCYTLAMASGILVHRASRTSSFTTDVYDDYVFLAWSGMINNYYVFLACIRPMNGSIPMDDQSPPSHLGDGRSLMGSMKIHHKSIMNYFLNKYVTSAGAAVIECQSRRSSEEVGHSSRSVAAFPTMSRMIIGRYGVVYASRAKLTNTEVLHE